MENEDKMTAAVLSETPHDEGHETLNATASAANMTQGIYNHE